MGDNNVPEKKTLIDYASCAGCAAKIPSKELAQVLRSLPAVSDERLLIGHSTFDDAAVFRLSADLALVQTVDFFPPVLDNPYLFGQCAAANSISDVYAMGGEPLTALSIVCFPNNELDLSVLGEILRGGGEKAKEANCVIVGGHSVRDPEIKFGLAVTGTIHPDRIASNAGAKPGDRLVLTKPLGMGALTTAYRKKVASADLMNRAGQQMARLNNHAAAAMRAVGINGAVHAATDVTGFGLLGHARNVAKASGVTMVFRANKIPVFESALDFAAQKLSSGAYKQNMILLEGLVELPESFSEALQRVIYDSETSGGLLIAVSEDKLDALMTELRNRGVKESVEVGFVESSGPNLLRVVS